jgi:23S rRNA G2445 N2-methylase RlmL
MDAEDEVKVVKYELLATCSKGMEMATFYRDIGNHLKQHFSGWRAALVVGEESPWKQFGLHRQSTHCLVNGTLPIRVVIFEHFEGKRSSLEGHPPS